MLVLVALCLVPLLLTGPAAAFLYIALLKQGHRCLRWIFWALLVVVTILLGILIAHTFGNFFPGPGCFTTLLTPAAVILTLLVFRTQARRFYQSVGDDPVRRRWFRAGMLLLPALQLSAPLIGFGYARSCDVLNRRAAQPIIAALESYHQDHGRYPMLAGRHQSDLGFLVRVSLNSWAIRVQRAQPDGSCRTSDIHRHGA